MTLASDYSPLVDLEDSDFLPGSTEVEWAEHAYHHRPQSRVATRTAGSRGVERRSHRVRAAVVAIVILLLVTSCVFLVTTQAGSRPAQSPPARTLTVRPSKTSVFGGPVVTPPFLRPSPFSYPEFVSPPKR
jgi:hypothetical protein